MNNIKKTLIIGEDYIEKWQALANTMAALINVPAGLIMRITGEKIEVCVS